MVLDTERVKSIFLAALDHGPAARLEAFLTDACGDDRGLRARVEELLDAHEVLGTFYEPETDPDSEEFAAATPECPGALIGRYRLLEELGAGGFGIVYLAEQQEPVKRNVALKVLKPGMDTREVIARFEMERQSLALMDHVNIARVFDAGATESGRPYFVMELVHGVPITEYCNAHAIPLSERLELFRTVCQAIQHAHQKGVIHRDIKPSNVLVASGDGRPVVKVIDFGIAKAIDPSPTESLLHTGAGRLIGSPLYMSPEQAEAGGLDVDTRTDIYSLGVLLYELVSGVTPLDPHQFEESSCNEWRRMIREQEPSKPSTRIIGSADETTVTIGTGRHDPRRLRALVRGDLDCIVMKALEKDRARRYQTAGDFEEDVRRYLNQEPVDARPPSTIYRLRKFARRHKVALSTAGLVAVSLILGSVVSTVQALHARQAEAFAEGEANRAKAVVSLVMEILDSANPDDAKGTDLTVRELLDDFSAGLEERLQDQPEVAAQIHATIGNAYRRLALPDEAEPHLIAALDLRRRVYGDDHVRVAESLLDYSFNCWERKDYAEAEAWARKAIEIYRRQPQQSEAMIGALRHLQLFLYAQYKEDEGDAAAEEALAIADDLGVGAHPDVAIVLHNMARKKVARGEYKAGETLARRALAMHRSVHGDQHPETAWSLMALAYALWMQKDYAEAELHYRDALSIFRKQFGAGYRAADAALNSLVGVLHDQGDNETPVALWREALELRLARYGENHPSVARAQGGLAESLRIAGNPEEAGPLYRQALDHLRRDGACSEDNREISDLVQGFARLLEAQGDYAALESHWRETLELRQRELGDDHSRTAWARMQLAGALRYQDAGAPEALRQYEKALAVFREQHSYVAEALGGMAAVLSAQHRWEEAAECSRQALAVFRQHASRNDEKSHLARSIVVHANLLSSIGRHDEAQPLYEEARELFERLIATSPDTDTAEIANWHANLGEIHVRLGRPDAALAELGRAIELVPAFGRPYLLRSEVYLGTERYAEALQDADQVVRLSGTVPAFRRRAAVYVALRQYDQALADLDAAEALNPRDVNVLRDRARLSIVQKDYERALSDLSRALQLDDQHVPTWISRSAANCELEQWDDAISDLSRAVSLDESNTAALVPLANLLAACPDADFRDPCLAVDLAEKAAEAAPDNGACWSALGVARYRFAEYREALKALKRSEELKVGRRFGVNAMYMAMSHAQLDEPREAREWYDRAVRWMETNAPDDAEMGRLNAEAGGVLGLNDETPTQPEERLTGPSTGEQ